MKGCAIWCCSAFLSHDDAEGGADSPSYYSLLDVPVTATPEEIKRAYKKQSLQMHPDKLAQRGVTLTEADRLNFVRMKEGYDVLSSPKDKALYDSLGEKGYKWSKDPMSIDRDELFKNFCNSSILDRFKIFSVFLIVAAVLLAPLIVFCIRTDGGLTEAPYTAILIPLWIVDALVLLVHLKSISLPSATPPEDDDGTWRDPFPRSERLLSALSFVCVATFEVLAATRVDGYISVDYAIVFIPYYIWEALKIFSTVPVAFMSIISVEEVENMMEKSYFNFTPDEREKLEKQYKVLLPSTHPDYIMAVQARNSAKFNLLWIVMRIVLVVFAVLHLDGDITWSWWLVFLPFWILACCVCCVSCQGFVAANSELANIDEEMGNPEYGAVDHPESKLSPEEKEMLKAELSDAAQSSLSACCGIFFGTGFVALVVGKFAGATYSSIWIIFPLLLVVGILLCCFGYCIFGANQSVYEESVGRGVSRPGAEGGAGGPTEPLIPEHEAPDLTPPFVAASLQELSVKDLKALAKVHGIDTNDCFEKQDVVNKLVSYDPAAAEEERKREAEASAERARVAKEKEEAALAKAAAKAKELKELEEVQVRLADSDDLD
jgi:curved DNA-binding protein CbpA